MDWLLHNFIADMPGPDFLLFYGGAIALTLAGCWWALRRIDPTVFEPPPLVPSQPDPYEIAYLRGGENEVTRTIIFDLIQRGYLAVRDEKTRQSIERAPNPPDPRHLAAIERQALDGLSEPRTAQDIFGSGRLSSQIGSRCEAYRQRLLDQNLLASPETQRSSRWIALMAGLVIIGLGGYKLLVALAKGRTNVGFLIMMGIVGVVILFYIIRSRRLTVKGQKYLRELQTAFDGLKGQVLAITPGGATVNPALPLLVGLFGVNILAGTSYDSYHRMFRKAAASSTGGCGSCSSASCGGGCGGGGCGGCGGGCGGCGG